MLQNVLMVRGAWWAMGYGQWATVDLTGRFLPFAVFRALYSLLVTR